MLPSFFFVTKPRRARRYLIAFLAVAASLHAAVGTWNGGWPPPAGSYNSGNDQNLPLSATVQESPPSITLTFHKPGPSIPSGPNGGGYYVYRKLRDGTSWGDPVATVAAGATSYVDTAVSVGVAYEYKVAIPTYSPLGAAANYIIVGIRVDQTAPRGRVVLVVSQTIADGLPAELEAYQRELGADGWTVHTITAPVGNYNGDGNLHQPVRTAIQALNTTYPGEIKNIILLGKVPVARTGISDGIRPDGHASSYAEAADSYYAEMDGNWNDTGANTQTGYAANIAGDGKFDASTVSALGSGQKIEFGFGRIDLSYGQASEIATTRLYLEKLSRYRRASSDFQPGRKGAIRKGYDNVDETGWMCLPSLLGPGKIVTIASTADLPSDPTGRFDTDGLFTRESNSGPFLFYFKGTGMLDARDDDSRAVFWSGMQSHWGFWADTGGGKMPGRLATDSYTLSFTWSIWGCRFWYHRLGLGGDMGDVLRTTLNNSSSSSGFYSYVTGGTTNGDKNGRLWLSHMGDPTLRLFPVRPPRNLTASSSGPDGVSLAWTSSDDTGLQGVHIYRAPSPTGPWTRLTPAGSPYSGNNYTDTPPSAGDWTYSVRAVKLESTSCGTYLNPSLGATVTVQTGAASAALAISTTSLSPANWQTSAPVSLQATGGNLPYTWSLAGGSLPDGLALSADGVITGAPTRGGVTHQPVFQVRDFRGATAQLAYELGVTTRRVVTVPVAADAMAKSSVSFKDYNFGTSTDLLIVKSANNSPLYTDSIGFLRFVLPSLASGERLEAARLRLTFGGGTATTATTTLSAALLADAGDTWVEGTVPGSASTGSPLTYTNRPTALNTGVAAATLLGSFAANLPVSLDVLPHCAETFANDPAKILSLVLSSNTVSSLVVCSRENPPVARSAVDLYLTHEPLITVSRPLYGSASIPSGQGLVLSTSVTDTSATTQTWTKLGGPGTVTFFNTTGAGTEAGFSEPGRYTLQLAADDGQLLSRKTIDVQVVATDSTARTDSLVLHHRFDESSGTSAADTAPDAVAHTGTLTPSVTDGLAWSPSGGRVRGALQFTAPNSYVAVADQDTLDNTNRLTIALWLNPAAGTIDANIRGLLSKRVGSNSNEAYTLYLQNGRVYVRFNSSNITRNTTNVVLTAGKWTHVAAVYDGTQAGTSNCVVIYIDGVSVPLSGSLETDATIPNTASPLWIGQINAGSATYSFLGLLDDVRIYRGRSLSADDVSGLATSEATRIVLTPPAGDPPAGVPFALNATLSEGGVTLPSGAASLQWSKSAGVSPLAFSSPSAASTQATPASEGFLTLRLTVDNGSVATFAETNLTIAAPASGFASWSAATPWPQGADFSSSGDPDRDGLPNLLEYALNFDPLSADPSANHPSASTVGGHLAFTFTRDPARNTLTYEVQASPDLSPGSWTTLARSAAGAATVDVNGGTLSINETTEGGLRRVTITDATPLSEVSRRFLRLNVAQP